MRGGRGRGCWRIVRVILLRRWMVSVCREALMDSASCLHNVMHMAVQNILTVTNTSSKVHQVHHSSHINVMVRKLASGPLLD